MPRDAPRPEATISSRNSGTSGTPTSAIDFFIFEVAIAHPGQTAETMRHVRCRVTQQGELQSARGLLVDHLETPEREEQVGLDSFAERGVGEHQSWIGHVQGALGTDDGKLAAAGLVIELRDDRCASS